MRAQTIGHPLARRQVLIGTGAALALPGCATTATRTAAATACLPRVRISPDRVIRTVAGLRPFRPAGFRVEREALGDKAVVHNYGHGGAGITLSWGSSRLATALGLPGHRGSVAVLGAGVMALTTARLVQEAGFAVTLYAAQLPPHTTSNIAGGQVHAYGHYDRDAVSPEWRARLDAAYDYSVRRFQIMVGDDYGIHWLPTYVDTANPRGGPHMPGYRQLERAEHPFALDHVARYETMYVETGRFLRTLSRDIEIAGGRFVVRRFASVADVAALPETLIFNCTGLGAGALFGDASLYPIRGQLAILVPQPEIGYAFNGAAGYMFPRADGIVVGGTYEKHVAEPEPQPADIDRILTSMRGLFTGWRCG